MKICYVIKCNSFLPTVSLAFLLLCSKYNVNPFLLKLLCLKKSALVACYGRVFLYFRCCWLVDIFLLLYLLFHMWLVLYCCSNVFSFFLVFVDAVVFVHFAVVVRYVATAVFVVPRGVVAAVLLKYCQLILVQLWYLFYLQLWYLFFLQP